MQASFRHTLRILIPLAMPLMLTIGCEDVVQVDLKAAEPQLVIEGYLAVNVLEGAYFRITRSIDFFQASRPEYVDDAQVIVADDRGVVDSLQSVGGGVYRFHGLHSTPGTTYHAIVTIADRQFEATTTMPAGIPIDSLTAEYQKGGGIGSGEDEGYRLHVFFRDPPSTREYARIILWRNGHFLSDAYYLYDGKFSDGKTVDYNYFLEVYRAGSTASVELQAMDEATYDYFSTLREVIVWDAPTNTFDVTPANPNTNWSGGALGFFGAFNVDTRGLLITDSTSTASEPGSKTQLMTDHPRSVR